MPFGGSTYDRELDGDRLAGQLGRVFDAMRDGKWRTLAEIQEIVGVQDSLPAISARLRDFRKPKFGDHTVNRRRKGEPKSGLFEYQLVLNNHPVETDLATPLTPEDAAFQNEFTKPVTAPCAEHHIHNCCFCHPEAKCG